MNSDQKPGGRGFERTRPAWLVASMAVIIVGALVGGTAAAMGQLTERPLASALAHPAIGYYTRPTHDLVAELSRHLEDGDVRLSFDEGTGYLRSVLDALHVPVESQMLVMSKTGVQGLYTGPANPRAIFFNDAVTVGYIRGAPLVELAVHDPQQGVLFYTLDQKPQPRPLFERRQACLSCHQVYSTLHVPGMVARSVFMAPDGLPLSQFGSYHPDDRTLSRQRWGVVRYRHARLDAAHGERQRHQRRDTRDDDLRQHAEPHISRWRVRRARLRDGAQRHRGADGVSAPGPHDEPDHTRRVGRPARGVRPSGRSGRRSVAGRRQRAGGLSVVRRRGTVDRRDQGDGRFRREVCRARPGRQSGPIVTATRPRTSSAAVSLQLHDLLDCIWRLADRRAWGHLRPPVGRSLGARHEPEVRAAVRGRPPRRRRDPARDAPRSAGRFQRAESH